MKKVAMLSVHTCPLASQEGKETGGMNVYVLQLSLRLAKKGIIVDIFTRSQDTNQPNIVYVLPNLRVIHLKAGPQKAVAKKEIFNYLSEFTENFLDFMQKESITYDLIHSHYYLSGLAGLEINNKLEQKIPLVHTFHTLGLMKNLVAREKSETEETERINAEFTLTKKADKIIAGSELDKDYLIYLYGCEEKKIEVIYPGVDTNHFKPMEKQLAEKYVGADFNHKTILFVGRIEPLKGIDTLLYAMKILLTKNPSLKLCLWIIGGDVSQKTYLWSRELQKLEHVRQILKLTASVKFVGQRHQEDLPYYYNASELVIMPSHYESFGMAALEALACGTPVITTNVSGITDLLDSKHQSLVTSVNNPLELAEKINNLLTDESKYQKISRDVVELVADLDWKNIAGEVLDVYKSV